VGSGPFPTELLNETGEKIREKGNEYGATTGRPRRCGWLDLPALKYAIMINGVTKLFMMKADVLSIMDKVLVCEKYRLEDGTVTEELPFEINDIRIDPVLREFKSWKGLEISSGVYEDLPAELRNYIDYLEDQLGVPIEIISMGPDRKNTILRNKMLAPQL
jgi:adenylosuccinate synthase